MEKFEGFTSEGIIDFYNYIIRHIRLIKNYYLNDIWIIKTFRGRPKKETERKNYELKIIERIPYTGACACGYDCIVEKVYFKLSYRNINGRKFIYKTGLYLRGICSEDNRTGGYNIMFRRGN